MCSLFESTVKKLVKELRDKELKPVRCFLHATKIRQFSLIGRKKPRSRFFKQDDIPLDVSLMDIFKPSFLVPDAVDTALEVEGRISATMVWGQQAGGSVDAGVEVGLSEMTAGFQGASLDYKVVSTPYRIWTDLQKRELMDPEPSFLKQCQKTEMNLYVVTDTVELRDDTVLRDYSSMNFWGRCSFILNTFIKGKGQGEFFKVRETTHTVQKGLVMAYKRKQLVFPVDGGWDILHVSNDEEETFPKVDWQCRFGEVIMTVGPGKYCSKGYYTVLEEILWKPFVLDFEHFQEEISQKVSAVAELSKDIQSLVFAYILAVLGDGREALLGLMDTLEQEPSDHLNGPGGVILKELREYGSWTWPDPKGSILYLLEALMVLSDMQHHLLAQSMKKRILSQQLDLVRSILEPNFIYPWSIPFTLKPELLTPLQGEGMVLTYGLLDECGLKMALESSRSTWDLEAKKPLCALYGALSVLQQLAAD